MRCRVALWLFHAAAIAVGCNSACAQEKAGQAVPCASEEYRQLDFWLGEWEVKNPEGTAVGHSRIEKILNGCAIQENWEGANGWPGKSFNAYNRVVGAWQQFWVSSWGSVTEFRGEAAHDRMVYLADTADREGRPVRRRMTLEALEPDRVRQLTELSYDDGKSWSMDYDFTYARVSPQQP